MPVAVSQRTGKSGNDDFGPEVTNDPYEVSEHLFMRPFRERVLCAFRKTKLVIRGEKLLGMIEPARSVKLFSADNAKSFEQFATQKIHTAFAACGREVCGSDSLAARKPCQQCAVFIIGMRAGMKNTPDHIEAFERLRQPHGPAVFRGLGGG